MTKKKNIKVSIVVPVYNVESSLRHCLDTLVHQDITIDEYEIILIDDGSADSSLQICNEFASKYDNIVVATQINAGASVARSKGIEMSNGEYIFFVDSDDYITENVLNELYERALENECDILFFNYYVETETKRRCNKTFEAINRNKVISGEYLAANIDDFGSLWRGIYKRDFIVGNSLRFTEGIIHQDTDFNYRAYPLAKRVMIVEMNVYHYRNIGESATRSDKVEKLQLMSYSDFVVAKNIREFISSTNLPFDLKNHYSELSNSLLISALLILLEKRDVYGPFFVNKCVHYSFDNKLLPIKGKTHSWKTTLLIPFVNLIGWSLMHKR